jgi:hypothetical protein
MRKPRRQDQDRHLAELKVQLKERDERIKGLRRELSEAEELVSEEREHIEDVDRLIDSWIEAFDMKQDDKGVWTLDKWAKSRDDAFKAYGELVRKWNRFVGDYNAAVLKGKRNVGRPLAADAGDVERVRKLRKEGRSLRGIVLDTGLGLPTVRTIVARDAGSDRVTKKRWQKLHPGEKWEDRSYTPVGALERIDPGRFKEEPWRARTRAALPKRIGEVLERGRELVKAAKGQR